MMICSRRRCSSQFITVSSSISAMKHAKTEEMASYYFEPLLYGKSKVGTTSPVAAMLAA